jgi:Spondin_N
MTDSRTTKKVLPGLAISLLLLSTLPTHRVFLAEDGPHPRHFQVTITNLTRGQQFTPILVVTHRGGLKLFTLGQPAISELATLAEEGDTAPLSQLLSSMPAVGEVANSSGLLDPGHSVTVTVKGGGQFKHLSLAAMLIPTNDGFFSLNGIEAPDGHRTLMLFSPAYDAGSERNDETCASIPGPFFAECGGPGTGGKPGEGEGFVHIHAGIHGIGDLRLEMRDWRNPVAQVTIRRMPVGA